MNDRQRRRIRRDTLVVAVVALVLAIVYMVFTW